MWKLSIIIIREGEEESQVWLLVAAVGSFRDNKEDATETRLQYSFPGVFGRPLAQQYSMAPV